MEKIRFFDPKELPQQSLDSVTIFRSSNGNIQMRLTAPKIVVYDKPESLTVYPHGVHLLVFSEDSTLVADLKADSAVSYDERKWMAAWNNVVVIDYRTGDTSYMQDITWNSAEGRIFSDHPVRSVNGQRVTIGDRFESDEGFTNPQIEGQRGTIEFNDQ